jgi:hypothetical protein
MQLTPPFPLINHNRCSVEETPNTWQFFLYNMRGRVLVSHSCAKTCYEAGEKHFWDRVAVLYVTIQHEKAASTKIAALTNDYRRKSKAAKIQKLETDFLLLLEEIDNTQHELREYLASQSQSDFLQKIEPVIMPV